MMFIPRLRENQSTVAYRPAFETRTDGQTQAAPWQYSSETLEETIQEYYA